MALNYKMERIAQAFKDKGLTVWIKKRKERTDTYLFVTNGTCVLYVQQDLFEYIDVSYLYVPSKRNGTGCRVLSTVEDINQIVKLIDELSTPTIEKLNNLGCSIIGKVQFFKNFNEWFEQYYDKDNLKKY